MNSESTVLSYPWNHSTYGVISAICVRSAFSVAVVAYMRPTTPWFLVLAAFTSATLLVVYDLSMLATKAPVTIELSDHAALCRFAFGRLVNVEYSHIGFLQYDSTRGRFLGFAAKLVISRSKVLFVEHRAMKQFPALVRMLREKNPSCIVDSCFQEMIAPSPTQVKSEFS